MNSKINRVTKILATTTLWVSIGLLNLSNSFAKTLAQGEILTDEGYPYKMLIKRTSQVKLIYKGAKNITCRVEIQYKQQTWVGQTYNTNQKNFANKPLTECMDRELAKKILKATF
ncbi:hypothetical protein [Paraglaciecola sp. L3A3]|uniref:hypothetical protein n=1 Tax=Paraglaciecola sp. L3A3 TaxID=2686358 RepID=UPI00131EC531|nr:hypothetical protein [Paraglaciecola sp. L3A3]